MLHLSRAAALVMAAVSAALILTAEIWEISLAIFSETFSVAEDETVTITDRRKAQVYVLPSVLRLKKLCLDVLRNLSSRIKKNVRPVTELGQNRELHRKPAASAGEKEVVYSQQSLFGMMQNVQTCPDCGGTGKVIREKCPDCRGTGYISKKVRKTVEIPAGIDNGQSVRVRGYGEPGRNGGPRGDLLVEVLVSRSNAFERQDMNIFSNASISFGIAALGGDIRIRTVDGDIIYTVAPGTQSGTRIRLKGKRSTIDPKQGSTWRPLCNTDCQHADGLKQRGKRGVA